MPTNVAQKELARLLVLEHGFQKASELSGIRYDLIRKWASLGKWKANGKPSQTFTTVKNVVDNVANELEANKRETKLHLSRYVAKSARDASTLPKNKRLRESGNVHKVAQVGSLVWPEENKGASILNLGILVGNAPVKRVEGKTLDVEASEA